MNILELLKVAGYNVSKYNDKTLVITGNCLFKKIENKETEWQIRIYGDWYKTTYAEIFELYYADRKERLGR